jgi:hypothetical protein
MTDKLARAKEFEENTTRFKEWKANMEAMGYKETDKEYVEQKAKLFDELNMSRYYPPWYRPEDLGMAPSPQEMAGARARRRPWPRSTETGWKT